VASGLLEVKVHGMERLLYNFLRPHKEFKYKPPVQDSGLAIAGNMPGKWQYLIAMGQQTILCMQQNCS
jgi:hypothetical protein